MTAVNVCAGLALPVPGLGRAKATRGSLGPSDLAPGRVVLAPAAGRAAVVLRVEFALGPLEHVAWPMG